MCVVNSGLTCESAWEFPRLSTDKVFLTEPPTVSDTETVAMSEVLKLDTRKHSKIYLTNDRLFMMCPIHVAFVLETKTWGKESTQSNYVVHHAYDTCRVVCINIDNTASLQAPKLPPDAIIETEKQEIIMALSDHHTQDAKAWSADYIKNKGDGVVILLHGPPGVGKTYTVGE